jgi:hypothetical protein
LIHRVSSGLPRAVPVNNIAVQALVAAYAGKKNIVDESSARAAVTEVTAEDHRDSSNTSPAGVTGGAFTCHQYVITTNAAAVLIPNVIWST